jgi:hypothetical protein
MARKVYRVLPDGDNWVVKKDGVVLSNHYKKDPAIDSARSLALSNQPSQVVVHRSDGTIEKEWTYGDDPYPPPG